MKTRILSALLALLPFVCHSQIFHSAFDISSTPIALSDGVYKKADEFAGFTEIAENGDGYRVEVLTFNNSDRIDLELNWYGEDDMWYKISLREMTLNGRRFDGVSADDYFAVMNIHFDPWARGQVSAFADIRHRDTVVFPPQPEAFDRIVIIPCWDCFDPIPETGNHAVFEYTIEQIAVPLSPDFNYDEQVDFSDFLILSDSFGFRAKDLGANHPMHFRGDANFDGVTDFTDFLILSESFGTSRVQAASVPEPSGLAMFASALVSFAGIRRRHR